MEIAFGDFLLFIVWCGYFSCLRHLICRRLGCPERLLPPFVMTLAVCVLKLSGAYAHSLHAGFYFMLALGLLGLWLMAKDFGWRLYRGFFCQGQCMWLFYFLAFLAFLQSWLFSPGMSNVDEMHHWGWIISGLGHYHAINSYPRLGSFDNYTCGSALWAYFVNRFFLTPYKGGLTNWANVMLSFICFMPVLGFFRFGRNGLSLSSCICGVCGFVLLCPENPILNCLGWLLVLLALISPYARGENGIQQIAFEAFFVFFAFLLLMPGKDDSYYRILVPDHLIFLPAMAALLGYLARPGLKSFLWLAPCLASCYLFKRPGLFLAGAAAVTIVLHFSFLKGGTFLLALKRRRIWLACLFATAFLLLVAALALPPLVWTGFCKRTKAFGEFPLADKYGINDIRACFTDNKNPIAYIRKEYFKKWIGQEVLDLKFGKKSPLGFARPLLGLMKGGPFLPEGFVPTYPKVLLACGILQLILLALLFKRGRLAWLLAAALFLFALLHSFGLFINYCLVFGKHHEAYALPCYARYAAPMVKLELAFTAGLFLWHVKAGKEGRLKKCLAFAAMFLAFGLALGCNPVRHVAVKDYMAMTRAHMSALSKRFDFHGKNVLFLCRNDGSFEISGSLQMQYPTCPKSVHSFGLAGRILPSLAKYDYVWLMQDAFHDTAVCSNRLELIGKRFRKDMAAEVLAARDARIEELMRLREGKPIAKGNIVHADELGSISQSCLLRPAEKPDEFLVEFIDSHIATNILANGDFKEGFEGWKVTNPSRTFLSKDGGSSLAALPGGCSLNRKVSLKGGHYYGLRLFVKGGFDYEYCGMLGETYIVLRGNKNWKKASLYFRQDKDRALDLQLNGRRGATNFYRNVQLVDMGDGVHED